MKKRVFITGISGCVGHYLFDELANDPTYELNLLVRHPEKLRFNYQAYQNISLIYDDLKNIREHADLIRQMDVVIHLAAEWGSYAGNYDYTLGLFDLLDPQQCQKVLYFSTASILGPDNLPVREAGRLGTPYVRAKYDVYRKLPDLKIYPRVVTLFPTWVLGGDIHHPYSHASEGMLALRKWLWLIRFFTVDATFHFIHARDIARIAKYLLKNESPGKDLVLGNTPLSASRFLKEACQFFNQRVYFQVPITPPLVKALAFLTGRRLQSWDLYCFERRHFIHQTVNAESFGSSSELQSVEQVLSDLVGPKAV